MRVTVTCAIMVYNGETYHNGEYLEIESEVARQTLVADRCIEVLSEKKVVVQSDSTIKTQGRRK